MNEMIFLIITLYYIIVFVLVGIAGSFGIGLSNEIYDIDTCLSDKKEFTRCVFMWQFAVYEWFCPDINTIGQVILEIITTISVFHLNILVFSILIILEIFRFIILGFIFIFGVRKYRCKVCKRKYLEVPKYCKCGIQLGVKDEYWIWKGEHYKATENCEEINESES